MRGPMSEEHPNISDDDDLELTSDERAALKVELDRMERGVLRRIDPGPRAMVIAIAVLVVIVAGILPWVGGVSGWQVLFGTSPGADAKVDVVPRVFCIGVFAFGLLGSVLALATRRWGIAWLCALGSGAFTVIGLLSIWSQQTTASHQPGPGPGIGLILAVLAMLVLVVTWARVVWSRPGGLFAHRTD
jgi:hypothetical protein